MRTEGEIRAEIERVYEEPEKRDEYMARLFRKFPPDEPEETERVAPSGDSRW